MKRQILESAVEEREPDAVDTVKDFCDYYESKFVEIKELLDMITIDRLDDIVTAKDIAENCASDLY